MEVAGRLAAAMAGCGHSEDVVREKLLEIVEDEGEAGLSRTYAMHLSRGLGVPQDSRRAFAMLVAAAEQGSPEAQTQVATVLYTGAEGIPRDRVAARKWLSLAAEHGDTRAMHNLAVMHSNGEGGLRDETTANVWLHRAASLDDPLAQSLLGSRLMQGLGLGRNYRKAADAEADAVGWLERAAEQRVPLAMYNLGVAYANGQGVDLDLSLAEVWTRRAAEAGHPDAVAAMAMSADTPRDQPVEVEVPQPRARGARPQRTQRRKGKTKASAKVETKRRIASEMAGTVVTQRSPPQPTAEPAELLNLDETMMATDFTHGVTSMHDEGLLDGSTHCDPPHEFERLSESALAEPRDWDPVLRDWRFERFDERPWSAGSVADSDVESSCAPSESDPEPASYSDFIEPFERLHGSSDMLYSMTLVNGFG